MLHSAQDLTQQSLSMLLILASTPKCYVREAICTTEKSVSSSLWSWHASFSILLLVCVEKHSTILNGFLDYRKFCVLSIRYSKEIQM